MSTYNCNITGMQPPPNEFWYDGRMRPERPIGGQGCMYNQLYFDIDEVSFILVWNVGNITAMQFIYLLNNSPQKYIKLSCTNLSTLEIHKVFVLWFLCTNGSICLYFVILSRRGCPWEGRICPGGGGGAGLSGGSCLGVLSEVSDLKVLSESSWSRDLDRGVLSEGSCPGCLVRGSCLSGGLSGGSCPRCLI